MLCARSGERSTTSRHSQTLPVLQALAVLAVNKQAAYRCLVLGYKTTTCHWPAAVVRTKAAGHAGGAGGTYAGCSLALAASPAGFVPPPEVIAMRMLLNVIKMNKILSIFQHMYQWVAGKTTEGVGHKRMGSGTKRHWVQSFTLQEKEYWMKMSLGSCLELPAAASWH